MARGWVDWKLRQQGFGRGPLRPPTPVAPRPPMVVNPRSGGMPTPMGNGTGKRLTLPGPGPAAGGRYNMYWPGQGVPAPKPGIPPPASSDWYGPGSPFQQARRAAAWALGRKIARLHPVGRFVDVGFALMDGDWGITKPGQPAVPKGYQFGANWIKRCDIGGVKDVVSWSTSAISTLPCPLPGQVPNAYVGTAIPNSSRWVGIGAEASKVPWRYNVREQWYLPSNRPLAPPVWNPGQAAQAPRVAPAPDTVPRSSPDPYWDPKAKRRTIPRPAVGVRTKPAPYYDGTNKDPNGVDVPSLPRPREEKHKFPGYGIIGDVYGTLTEIKDGLKCVEKNVRGFRIPKGAGLAQRIHAVGQYMYERPHTVDWGGITKCMIANHIEDKVIGKVNKLANQITKSPYWTRPVGVGTGSWAIRM